SAVSHRSSPSGYPAGCCSVWALYELFAEGGVGGWGGGDGGTRKGLSRRRGARRVRVRGWCGGPRGRAHRLTDPSRGARGAAPRADGAIYRGCNVENASYGLTICAERAAVFAAVAAGARHVEAVAVVSDSNAPIAPCGACRQVLYEFGPQMIVITAWAGRTE